MTRDDTRIFSRTEIKAALYAIGVALALTSYGALVFKDMLPTPLGMWSDGFQSAPAPGVIEARPIG